MPRRLTRHLVRETSYWLLAVFGFAYRRVKSSPELPGSIDHILVIRLDLMGDVLLTMPLVEALRVSYPTARITLLTLPYTAPLVRLYASVDESVVIDTNRIRTVGGLLNIQTWLQYGRAIRRLRAGRFDLAVSAYGRMASLWAFLSGATRTIGYAGEEFPSLLSDPLPGGRHRERMHEVEYIRRLAAHAGGLSVPVCLELSVPPWAHDTASQLLAEHGIGPADQLILIHAGSLHGSAKRWPAASWARFAETVQSRTEASILLVGAAADEAIARDVIARSAARIQTAVGQTDIATLIALLERADVVASGDSGPLHLAVALKRPLVAVYGPTDPVVYGPYQPSAPLRLHRKDLPCSPCYTLDGDAGCPLGDPICMRLVTVQSMADSAIELLGQSSETVI